MKNYSSVIIFPAIFLLISFGKYISGFTDPKNREFISNNNNPGKFDDSLRNYHPNKGE
ncbi:MAG: hypothetical protein JST15_01105 [Bacteroidetes bacterium]|nr:hypothetical protein [Bacteroidota bacterium]